MEPLSLGKRILGFITGWKFMLVAGLIIAAGAGYGGWTARGWKAGSDLAALQASFDADRQAMRDEADRVRDIGDQTGIEASRTFAQESAAISSGTSRVKQGIFNAQREAAAAGRPNCLLDRQWVQLYNEALHPADNADPAAGEPAAAPPGAGPVDQWDVQLVHAENAGRWAVCRSNLNALIDFELSLDNRIEKRSKPPVVTAP